MRKGVEAGRDAVYALIGDNALHLALAPLFPALFQARHRLHAARVTVTAARNRRNRCSRLYTAATGPRLRCLDHCFASCRLLRRLSRSACNGFR